MELLLATRDLRKDFGARTLFEGIGFGVREGERIGLIGPNGAGKSTLLGILAGRLEADRGEVTPRRGLVVAYLEQNPRLRDGATVLETLLEGGGGSEGMSSALATAGRLDLQDTHAAVGTLSGGWRKRVALGRELMKKPDLLLLDEPTNHLDIESILWLEDFLRRSPFATVTVTHDRAFLQKIATRILELDRRNPQGLLSVDGDYGAFVEAKERLLEAQSAQEERLRNRLRREWEWLRRGAKARTTKQKARIDRAEALGDEVERLAGLNRQGTVRLGFGGAENRPKRLLEAKGVAKSYGGRALFSDLNVFLGPGTRLGLLGPNGCGKSTLIRVLLGIEPPDRGEVFRSEHLEAAYFEQNRESLEPALSVRRTVCPSGDHVEFRGRPVPVWSYLDRFLFGKDQVDQPVGKLSGGEQSRLLLARLMLRPANLLVLDEPTNDLDLATLDVLEDVLKEFEGAVVLVSHDRYFLDQVSTKILAFPSLMEFADVTQWELWRESREPSRSPEPAAAPEPAPRKKRKLSYHETRDLQTIEARIQAAEGKVAELQEEMGRPEVATDSGRLTELAARLTEAQAEVERLYGRWEELERLRTELG